MSYIKFNNSTRKLYDFSIKIIDFHTVELSKLEQNLSGFGLYSDMDNLIGNYLDYKYDYKQMYLEDGVYKYTNDGHEWEETDENKDKQINYLENKIKELKNELNKKDYIFIKSEEYSLSNKKVPSEYDYTKLSVERDEIRDKINEYREEIKKLK